MQFEVVPAYELTLSEQASISNRAFAGYIAGWSDLDSAGLARFLSAQAADIWLSRFVCAGGAPLGFGYISRVGNISRLAGMATVPEARRTGAAGFLLSELLQECQARHDRAMVLEVFEQNVPALPLYQRHGFRELMRLFGWRRSPKKSTGTPGTAFDEISLIEASKMAGESDFPDIPWQVSRFIVPRLADAQAYQSGNSCVVISHPSTNRVRINAFLGEKERFKEILGALIENFSDREFWTPQVFPEHLGAEIFEPLGFVREPLNQLLMRRDLTR